MELWSRTWQREGITVGKMISNSQRQLGNHFDKDCFGIMHVTKPPILKWGLIDVIFFSFTFLKPFCVLLWSCVHNGNSVEKMTLLISRWFTKLPDQMGEWLGEIAVAIGIPATVPASICLLESVGRSPAWAWGVDWRCAHTPSSEFYFLQNQIWNGVGI